MLISLLLVLLAAPYAESERHLLEESLEKHEMNRRVRDAAVEAGLEEIDANDLMIDMKGTRDFPPPRSTVEYWEKRGFDLCKFFKDIRELVDELPFSKRRHLRTHAEFAEGYSQLYQVTQQNALLWMSVCKDPEIKEWLVHFVEEQMKQTIESDNDGDRMRTLLEVLGYVGSDEALDILFELQSKEAWVSDPPIQIRLEELPPEFTEAQVLYFRRAALRVIAYSGTDRALHAFATGEGLADDMRAFYGESFRTAAHAHFRVYRISLFYQKGAIEPKLKANIQAIYDKYGMEYNEKEHYKEPDKRVF